MIKRCKVDGADACVEKEQLALHNGYRLLHEGGTQLKADRAASAAIQKLLDAKFKLDLTKWNAAVAAAVAAPTTTPFVLAAAAARGDTKWAACVENIFVATDKTDANTKLASSYWYDTGMLAVNYGYTAGAPTAAAAAAPATKLRVDTFMRMVWKKSTLVGFGKKDRIVVAWYCKDPA